MSRPIKITNDPADAVTIDQIEVHGNTKTTLMLAKVDFLIEVENAEGKQLKSWQVKR